MTSVADFNWLLSTVAVPYALILVIPGPNLLVVSSAGLQSQSAALRAAMGVAVGAAMVAAITSAGASVLPDLASFQLVGSAVFCLLLLRSAAGLIRVMPQSGDLRPSPQTDRPSSPFLIGLGVAVCNPLTVPFFLGLFLSHPGLHQTTMAAAACATTFAMALFWYGFVAVVVSQSSATIARRSGQAYVRYPVALALVAVAASTASRLVPG